MESFALLEFQPSYQKEMLAMYVSRKQENVASQYFSAWQMLVFNISINSSVFSKWRGSNNIER